MNSRDFVDHAERSLNTGVDMGEQENLPDSETRTSSLQRFLQNPLKCSPLPVLMLLLVLAVLIGIFIGYEKFLAHFFDLLLHRGAR